MMDHYVIGKAPEGFKEKIYRVAALEKSGDKWTVHPAKEADVNKDGTPGYTAESFSCGPCHKLMWKNPKPIEIKNRKFIDLITKLLPEAAK